MPSSIEKQLSKTEKSSTATLIKRYSKDDIEIEKNRGKLTIQIATSILESSFHLRKLAIPEPAVPEPAVPESTVTAAKPLTLAHDNPYTTGKNKKFAWKSVVFDDANLFHEGESPSKKLAF